MSETGMRTLRRKPRSGVFLEPELIDSKAFQSLTGKAPLVFIAMLRKRRFQKRTGKKQRKILLNLNEIYLPYAEVKREYNISNAQLNRALDQIINRGLMKVVEVGGLLGQATVYGISDDWRNFGNPHLVIPPRIKDTRHIGNRGKGFQKGSKSRTKTRSLSTNTMLLPSLEPTDLTSPDKISASPESDGGPREPMDAGSRSAVAVGGNT